MPSDPYYHTKAHLEWREKVFRKAKYLCEECKKYGKSTAAVHAHHIRPRSDAPELARVVSNGMALCEACHNKIEPRTPQWKSRKSRST